MSGPTEKDIEDQIRLTGHAPETLEGGTIINLLPGWALDGFRRMDTRVTELERQMRELLWGPND